ncbi:SRPBCC family protein [Ferrimonas gelatinilytica]|uniref:Polyketide cyclase n=1 Tax=Ferrimonas gelatinilytica TaxID=1255257 RepID=A0ABP9S5L5_9GAMM
MIKGLKILLIVITVLVILGLALPRDFRVYREIEIAAPPESIYPYLNELFLWPLWAPWSDPNTRFTIGTPASGIGAQQSWEDDSGGGQMTIVASDPRFGIRYEIRYGNSAKVYPAQVGFQRVAPEQTRVYWQMEGEIDSPIVGPFLALLTGTMIGDPFEQGLSKLKWLVESPTTETPETPAASAE